MTDGLRGVWRMNNITAVVLASGLSKRMGCNKLLLEIDGSPMIMHILKLLKDFDFREVLVVTGYSEIIRMAGQLGYRNVFNDAPETGQSHSVVLGVAASPESEGWLFINGDMPHLQGGTIQTILDMAGEKNRERTPKIIVPRYEGRPGQPVYFPAFFYKELMALTGNGGGRQIIGRHPSEVIYIDIADSIQGVDVDTPEDYALCHKEV